MIALDRIPGMKRVGRSLNEVSEYLGGRNHRTLFAGEGVPRLPQLDSLTLGSRRQALGQLRVYLLPGTGWPGVAEGGAAWTRPWAKLMEQAGVAQAVPVPYGPASLTHSVTRMFTDPVLHTSEERALELILADLAKRPLAPGQQVFLIGHSYGAKVGGQVAEDLVQRGIPVKGLALMGARNEGLGDIVGHAPRVPQVIQIENLPGKPVATPPGTALTALDASDHSHMDLVLKPSRRLLEGLLSTMAAVPRH